MAKLKTYNCILFTDFQHTKLHPFQNLSLGFILPIFLEFRKFHPQYSYKIYSYIKKSVLMRTRTYCKVVPGFHPVKPCLVTKPFGKNKFNQFLEGYI